MTALTDDGMVDIQVQDVTKMWRTVERVQLNLQRIGYELQAIQRRYPDRRVRAVDSSGKLLDIL
jgi:hypothetical protein